MFVMNFNLCEQMAEIAERADMSVRNENTIIKIYVRMTDHVTDHMADKRL